MPLPPVVDPLLADLTSAQRAAVTTESAPLCVIASAGAGKTRVLTRRIAYRAAVGTADPAHTVAITFTRKAATELQQRLQQLGLEERVTAATFHSMASAQLQRWWADRRQRPPVLLERPARLLGPLAASRPGLTDVPVSELAGHIAWAKARLIGPADLAAEITAAGRFLGRGLDPVDLSGLYARYEDEKRRRGVVDFDDLLARCADAIDGDEDFAAAQRWRWQHVFVDEFQDLNPLQHRLLLAWLGRSVDLCVVGDPLQAVYGWNGADPGLLDSFAERWPTGEVIRLDENHRCSPQVVAAAAAVIGAAGSGLSSSRPDGPRPTLRSYGTDAAEARAIAAGLLRAHDDGRRWSACAVLARTNAQLVPIRAALVAAGIPVWSPTPGAILDEPVVRRVLAALGRDPSQPVQVVVADLAAEAAAIAATGQADDPGPTGGAAGPPGRVAATDPGGRCRPETAGGEDEERAALAILTDLARVYHAENPAGVVGQWLRWLPVAVRPDPGGRGSDAVTLSSFHRAKGLEWDAVWVAGLEEGLVPIGRATSAPACAEERRLLYVALTRAGREVHCSWAERRSFGAHPVPRTPSRWLDALAAGGALTGDRSRDHSGHMTGTDGGSPAHPGRAWRGRLRDQRNRIGAAPAARAGRPSAPPGWAEPDPALVGALEDWRLTAARSGGVPPHVVLHDTTLAAVASLRPRTEEELLAVPGLGPVKASRYGATLLSLVAAQPLSHHSA